MSFRASAARWFEALIPRPSVARAVEILADSGCVQLEKDRSSTLPLPDYTALTGPLETYRGFRQRYLGYWPAPRFEPVRKDALLEKRAVAALAALERWVGEAAPHVQRLEGLRRDRHELQCLADFLALILDHAGLDLSAASGARAPLAGALLMVADHATVPEMSEHVVAARAQGGGFGYVLALGPEAEVRQLVRGAGGRETRVLPLPDWLKGAPPQALAEVSRRIEQQDREIEGAYAALGELSERHRLDVILGELRRLEWFARHLEGIPVSEYLARVTGWTCSKQPSDLAAPLEAAGIPGVVNFLPAPKGMYPPTLTRNPAWARPFELFTRLAGTPGRNEADPTPLVAVVAPLLFGYMFGDVGQGAVLLAAGLLLRKRWPALGMLVTGGVMAMIFGLLFGSVFCREDLITPLWTSPLHDPLAVLAAPLAGGAVLILAGMLLGGLEEHWAGRGRAWFETDAGLILVYLGLLAALVWPLPGLTVAGAGLAWFIAGPALVARDQRHESLGAHAGELPERLLGMAVNTLSFVRVGAFAIAHAGLSAAVTTLAHAAGDGGIVVQVLGNVLILALEGLVVSIQTSRLILFEFFVRFVRAEGRPFSALAPPSANGRPS